MHSKAHVSVFTIGVVAAAVVGVSVTAGCTSNRKGPMRTSLTGITSESRTYRGHWVDQTEFVSIAGLLGTPAPGMIYHMIEKSEQESLLGISYDTKSFVLVGESAPADRDLAAEVSMLKQWIEEVDQLHARLVVMYAQRRTLESAYLRLASAEGTAEATNPPLSTSATNWMLSRVQADIEHRDADIESVTQRLRAVEQHIRDTSSRPGIIIAEWAADAEHRINVDAVPFARGATSRESVQSGYVVLGGVRVVVPFFSMDTSTMFLDIEEASPGSLKNLRHGAVTTYMLQAKEIAYTTTTSRATLAEFSVAFRSVEPSSWASAVADVQELGVEAMLSDIQRNVSGGRIGRFEWKRLDLNYSDRWNRPWHARSASEALELRDQAQRDLLGLAGVQCFEQESEPGDWATVIVQVMTPTRLAATMAGAYMSWSGALSQPGNVETLECKLLGERPPALIRECAEPEVSDGASR